MKISIITSVFNNESTIADTIESVLSQTYNNIEYIVVNGASTDRTGEIIEKYRNRIDIYICEQDRGIYDGLNKGIEAATGDVVGFLHSDDLYYDEKVVEKIAKTFETHHIDSVYGDLIYVDKENIDTIVRYWKSGEFSRVKLWMGWMPPHPTFYVKREVYMKYGGFDLQYKIAADYDTVLRFLGRERITTHYIREIFVRMRVGGESNKNLKNLFQKSQEDYRAICRNEIGSLHTLFFKNILKIGQFFSKPNM